MMYECNRSKRGRTVDPIMAGIDDVEVDSDDSDCPGLAAARQRSLAAEERQRCAREDSD